MDAKVVIADVSYERGEALAREVGAGSLYVPTDCVDEDDIAKAAADCGAAARRRDPPHRPGLARRPRTQRQKPATTRVAGRAPRQQRPAPPTRERS
jgi:hypothetical protein